MKVGIGRDHTLFALAPGYVRFYKQKHMRGERRFVGIVLNRGEKLPRDEAKYGRSRYCGLVEVVQPETPDSKEDTPVSAVSTSPT